MKTTTLRIRLLTFLVAFCSLTYELLLAHSLSVFMGNTVLRYSLTIGVYLASMGLGAYLYKESEKSEIRLLIKVELWLSFVGGLTVILLSALTVANLFLSSQNQGIPLQLVYGFYMLFSHSLIVIIGILSGFEIPSLMTLSRQFDAGSSNIVLALDYGGSLLGAVAFPLFLLPYLGLYASAHLMALLNLAACFILLSLEEPSKRWTKQALWLGLLLVVFTVLFCYSGASQAFFLKKHYRARNYNSLEELFSLDDVEGKVESIQSFYQRIDLVYHSDKDPAETFKRELLSRFSARPQSQESYTLYLNGQVQHASNTEQFYHEFFAHVPIQWAGLPKRVLILGGGDGLLAREFLKYSEIEHITQIELDPKMIELARKHEAFSRLNGNSLDHSKVRLIIGDAYNWLLQCEEDFDAVYLDFPFPVSHDLSKLYSVEFYRLVLRVLSAEGYLAADIPQKKELTDSLTSSLYAAGFQTTRVFHSGLNPSQTDLSDLEKRFVSDEALQEKFFGDGRDLMNLPEAKRQLALQSAFYELVKLIVKNSVVERFVFCQKKKRELNSDYQFYDIPLEALNILRFQEATNLSREGIFQEDLVNSVFRPTIPRPYFSNQTTKPR